MKIRVGMSGFAYPTWVGEVYPRGTKPKEFLRTYARRFDTVELQTFRRTAPTASAVEGWRLAVPDTFRFGAKASRGVTHAERRPFALEGLRVFTDAMRGLGAALGPVLIPTAGFMRCDPAGLAPFLDGLPADIAWAVEYQHESVWSPEVDGLLRERGVARVLNDEFRDSLGYAVTASHAYLRFRRVAYTTAQLRRRAALARQLASLGVEVFVFFRHTDDPACARPALAFRDLT